MWTFRFSILALLNMIPHFAIDLGRHLSGKRALLRRCPELHRALPYSSSFRDHSGGAFFEASAPL